jgi:hypothetical protein
MPITNPQGIAFSNDDIRPFARHARDHYYRAKLILSDWNARGMSAILTNSSSVVADGADTDGRPVITGADANNIINRIAEYITLIEQPGVLDTIIKVTGSSQ